MIKEILMAIVKYIVPLFLGYCINIIKTYKTKDKTQEEALKCLLRSNITSKYYVYNEIGNIPQYEKENINYMFEQYKKMNGNSYVEEIMEEINKLPLKK